MPQLSDTMTEGTLVKWLVKEGDAIKAGPDRRGSRNRQSHDGNGILRQRHARTASSSKRAKKSPVGGADRHADRQGRRKARESRAGEGACGVRKRSSSPKPAAEDAASSKAERVGQVVRARRRRRPSPHPRRVHQRCPCHRQPARQAHRRRTWASPSPTSKAPARTRRIVQSDVMAAVEAKKSAPPAGNEGRHAHAAAACRHASASGTTEKTTLSKMRIDHCRRVAAVEAEHPALLRNDRHRHRRRPTSLRKKLLDLFEKKEGVRISIGDIVAKAVACAASRPCRSSTARLMKRPTPSPASARREPGHGRRAAGWFDRAACSETSTRPSFKEIRVRSS